MAALVALAVFLWIVGSNKDIALPFLGSQFIDATGVVLLVNALMLVARVIEWDDILGNKDAWNVLMWFATLVALADGLNRVGFVTWVARGIASMVTGIPPLTVMAILVAFFFFVHYMFASLTAHAAAVLPVLLATGHGGAGPAREGVRAAARLLAGDDGRPLAVRHRTRARLLRKRLRLSP